MKHITFLILSVFCNFSIAQLTINDPVHLTPKQLVENILVDPGIVISNIKFNGSFLNANSPRKQAANFTTNFNPTNLGLNKGILLTTGNAQVALGPNNADNSSMPLWDGSGPQPNGYQENDADLDLLTTLPVKSVAVLEFDFFSTGLLLNFDYVFASEEYPEYVGSTFNDVFGFFLSGPGITGVKNIALIPNTSIPISINNVNNGEDNDGGNGTIPASNPNFYYNNSNIGLNPNFNSSSPSSYSVEYDGFTTPLKATAAIQCGETYHIKLAIGNVSDSAWDSGVLIKNFRIPPLGLVNQFGLSTVNACYGEVVNLSAGSGIVWPAGTQFIWKKDNVIIQSGILGATPDPSVLNVTVDGTYKLNVYTTSSCVIGEDSIDVTFAPQIPVVAPLPLTLCTELATTYTFNIDQTNLMTQNFNAADYTVSYYNAALTTDAQIKAGNPVGLIPTSVLATYLTSTTTTTIKVKIQSGLTDCIALPLPSFTLTVNIKPTGTISYPSSSYCTSVSTSQTVTNTVSSLGSYSVSPTSGLSINLSTGAFNPSLSTPGDYEIKYTVSGSTSCEYVTTANVNIKATPLAPVVLGNLSYGYNEIVLSPIISNVVGSNLLWYDSLTDTTGNSSAPLLDTSVFGIVNYFVSQSNSNGCESPREPFTITIEPLLPAPVLSITQPRCTLSKGNIKVDTPPLGTGYKYSKDNGDSYQSSNEFNSLSEGIYIIKYVEIATGRVSETVSVRIDAFTGVPNAPTGVVTFQPNCNTPKGTITIDLLPNSNYSYSKDNGVTYQGRVFDNLNPNTTYFISVKNLVSGCVSLQSSFFINAIPDNPDAPLGETTQPICSNPFGKIKIITPPEGTNFEYSKDGINFQSSAIFSNLAPNAVYQIYVKSISTGCISTGKTFVIDPTILPPSKPNAIGTNVCTNETISLSTPNVTGATYNWTGPNGFVSTDQNPEIFNAYTENEGIYKVTVSLIPDCPSLPGEIMIKVHPLPKPELSQNEYICINNQTNTVLNPTLDTNLDNSLYDFDWYKIDGAVPTLISSETQSTYFVNAAGTYGVIAKNINTNCSSEMITATVNETSPPENIKITPSDYFSDINTITINVLPLGNYEYQLNNGIFQSSNIFSNLSSGTYEIKVKNECGEINDEVSLISFPKFFTPNGDGYNDTWNIFDLKRQANSKIYIFDRFGKLLKTIVPRIEAGWDGFINGQPLPAGDYWFSIFYEENNQSKVFKSHFALKR